MTSRRAHTLIEILIVLALLSIIGAIAIPNIGFVNSFKEKQELNELKRDLMYLRSKAITDNCVYVFKLDVNQNTYTLSRSNDPAIIKTKKFNSSLKFITAKDSTATELSFSPSGSPSGAGSFAVQKKNKDKYRFSLVVASGKINIVQYK